MADPLSLLRVTGWLSTSCPRMPGVSRGTQASPGGPALQPPPWSDQGLSGCCSAGHVDGLRHGGDAHQPRAGGVHAAAGGRLPQLQGGDGEDLCFYPEKEACVSIINSQAEIYPTADSF